ncbi:MAG: D-alanyl-D-alanine carboxypeptidase [Syntrophomonadaceae bacterium]|nr:D-alanyl-D-alanine carboxypeptidase [Syntrophomonadaceae bacterium]
MKTIWGVDVVKKAPLLMAVGIIIWSLLAMVNPALGAPHVGAKAWVLYDLKSGQFLDGNNQREARPPASTTKIMTAIIALEYLELDEQAQVSQIAASTPATAIGVRAGQEMQVRDLIAAALLVSANDATVVLAERVAGSEPLFCYLMNKKAFVLGAFDTSFMNSNGLPADGHLSSCHDLFLISRYALQNQTFATTVALPSTVINHPGYPQGKQINNTNRMLTFYPGAKGIKTGTTNAAGQCLVTLAKREGRQLVSVVLKSGNRYGDSASILDYGFGSFTHSNLVSQKETFKRIKVEGGEWPEAEVYPERDVRAWIPEEGMIYLEKRVSLTYRPEAPIRAADKIGTLEVYYKGELVDIVGLTVKTTIEKRPQGIWRLIKKPKIVNDANSFEVDPA